MVIFSARSAALAGVLAAGVLCEALTCEPARAEYFAFGNTLNSGNAVLELDVGGTWVELTTLGVQGWISNGAFGTGGPIGTNTSYTVGADTSGNLYNDYFGFNLAALGSPSAGAITAANLVVYSGAISNNLTFNLYGATTLLSPMEAGSPAPTLYGEMTTGTSYGTFQLETSNAMQQLVFGLNQAAVNDISALAENGSMFAIAGHVEPPTVVPELSTWAMMLLGFAGLGFAGYRQRQKLAGTASV
jgi:hypothetical protein